MAEVQNRAVSLDEVQTHEYDRLVTGITGLDRVTGGGFVKGSLLLLGGDPGTGKSTLLMQVAKSIESNGGKVLYVSGEESKNQIKMRATRLGITSRDIYIVDDSNVDVIYECIEDIQPDLLIVDSIQTITSSESTGAMGGVNQIKDAIQHLMKIAKRQGLTTIVVGQVNKDGTIAGPKILEHMVDGVLYLMGNREETFRQLMAIKNRFGSTQERGNFEMGPHGLEDKECGSNPKKKKKSWVSKIFLAMLIFWLIGMITYFGGR